MTDDQLEYDLNDFIRSQQQLHNTNRQLTIHDLTHSAPPSETSTSSIRNAPTRAQRILMKLKYPSNPLRYLQTAHHLHDLFEATNLASLTPTVFTR